MKTKILIGTAGWSYEDWKGIVYPETFSKDFDPLQVLANWFNVIEIDSSYYHIPAESHVRSWCRRVRHLDDFQYTIKLWRGFTHDRNYSENDLNKFRGVLATLSAAKRLGSVLAQFPWSFKKSNENLKWLEKIVTLFGDHPLSIEVRHNSWLKDEMILEFCNENSIAFCNIDQPQLDQCIEPTAYATTNFSYIRFHGRNHANWFNTSNVFDRYDYLYNIEELQNWIRRIKNLSGEVEKIIIITNNHSKGQAVANSLELKTELSDSKITNVPQTLLNMYPRLIKTARIETKSDPEQLELF